MEEDYDYTTTNFSLKDKLCHIFVGVIGQKGQSNYKEIINNNGYLSTDIEILREKLLEDVYDIWLNYNHITLESIENAINKRFGKVKNEKGKI